MAKKAAEKKIMPGSTATVDAGEVARFSAMAAEWWDPLGKFRPLHRLNPVRVGFIRDQICGHFGLDKKSPKPLKNINILDIGCGGGLLCEPMSRLGAQVLGADAGEATIKMAALHASQQELDIAYRTTTAEALAEQGLAFDAILNMEVIEHVADRAVFLAACSHLLRPGGVMIAATLNRTAKSFALAVEGAEYLLGWLPRGTHDWSKFLTPKEFHDELRAAGLEVGETVGVTYNPLADRWSQSRDTGVNYMLTAKKPE